MPKILLLRSENSDSDPYKELLESEGIEILNLPVLEFKFINAEKLKKELCEPEKYEGIVFTSQRGVEAVEKIREKVENFDENWCDKVCFVVGEMTASKVKESLGWNLVLGKETGNAKALAQ